MALKNRILLIPGDNTWLEYPATNDYFTIKNHNNVEVEYVYDTTDGEAHTLSRGESIVAIKQTIFFRSKYVDRHTTIQVTLGVPQTVAIANLSDGIGASWAIKLDSWGLQKFSQDFRLWRDTFSTNISSAVWNINKTNGSAYTKQGSGVFSSGATPGDNYISHSRKHPRYQPNSGILLSTAGSIESPTALGGIRRFGIATIEDGYFFEVAEDGEMYVVVRQSDFQNIDAIQDQTVFPFEYDILASSIIYARVLYSGTVVWQDITSDIASVDTTTDEVTMTTALDAGDELCIVSVNDRKNNISSNLADNNIDISQQVLYDIQAQWRGAGNVTFTVRSETDTSVSTGFVATYRNLGQSDRANISNPALSAMIECRNVSGDGTDFKLKLGCMNISSEGGQEDIAEYKSAVSPNTPVVTVGDTEDEDVFLMIAHVPEYFNGRWNTRDCEVTRISAWSDQKSHMNIYSTFDPLFITGGLQLKDKLPDSCILYDNNLNIDNSVARNDEIDRDSLHVTTRARVQIDSSYSISKPSVSVESVITAGQYVVLTGQRELATGNASMGGSIELGERT